MKSKKIGEYTIFEDGRIISRKLKRPLKTWKNRGYVYVKLYGIQMSVHRILAEKFIPNPEHKPEINHKNGIKDDNRLENLEWVTHSENIQHAYDNGRIIQKGEHFRKFSEEDYLEIKRLRRQGHPYASISEAFGISRSYASIIVNKNI